MSYYVADATGYLGDLASIGGLANFRAWAETLNEPPVQKFLDEGMTENPRALSDALRRAGPSTSPKVDSIRRELVRFGEIAEELLILSDGTDSEDGSPP